MLAVYPSGGARYMRHCDNPDGNGRVLTMLYYLNPGWRAACHGGCLRLFHAEGSEQQQRSNGTADGPHEAGEAARCDDELATLAPVLDRAVCHTPLAPRATTAPFTLGCAPLTSARFASGRTRECRTR